MEDPRVTSFIVHINGKRVYFNRSSLEGYKPHLLRCRGDGAKLTENEEREARRLAQSADDAVRLATHQCMLARATDEQPLLFPVSPASP
jgi:hypothetical protein